jgi:hypothetical protein
MMCIVEDSDLERLNVVDPSDRRYKEKGSAKVERLSLLVEVPDKLMFDRDRSAEGGEWDGTPGRVLRRPKTADKQNST